ncbi:MAG: hypothetical protein JNM82_13300, partial [Rhodocyclaceae bacterium]|nr:hypothetical protein [Rhodocyclaceae bacterium]
PEQALSLIETHRLRLLGKPLGVAKLDAGPAAIQLQLSPATPVNPADIVMLIQSDRSFRLAGPDKLAWKKETASLKERVVAVKQLFGKLQGRRRARRAARSADHRKSHGTAP